MWSFETDPEFQASLDWIDEFTREEIEPLDLVFREPGDPWDPNSPAFAAMAPLREIVKQKQLWACHLEPELGGQGYGQVSLGLMNEILGRSRFGPSVFGCQAPDSGNAEILAKFGTPEQKEKYLKPLLNAEIASCYSMTEPQAGADPGEFLCTATRDGDDWVLNGTKTWISNGYLAGLVLVVCKTDPSAGAKGTSILIAETEGLDGYRVGRVLDKIGMKAQDTSELFFDEVELHRDQLLGGEEGKGFYQLMGDLPYERLIISVNAVGAIEGALAATIDYTKERRAFGQSVFDFQNSKFKLAEIATQARVARTYLDRCIQDLLDEKLDTVGASMAKMWTTDLQNRVIDECLQLFGGYGYTNEYMVGRMYIDARVQRIYGGTNEIMKEVISRSL